MNKFKFISTPIADLTIVEPTVFGDHRTTLWRHLVL